VAASLEAALALRRVACQPGEGEGDAAARFPLLARAAAGINEQEFETLAALRACIRGSAVTDEADARLAATRAERAANLSALRSLVSGMARDLAAKGAAESREPLLVRGRFCVAVRSNRRSELPKGSVRLGASSSGTWDSTGSAHVLHWKMPVAMPPAKNPFTPCVLNAPCLHQNCLQHSHRITSTPPHRQVPRCTWSLQQR
jgi:hypothetical protein